MTPPPDLRASDAERDRTVAALRRHATDGRLDIGELEERVQAALGARTHGELEGLTSDLPRSTSRRRSSRHRAEVRAYVGVMVLLVAVWAVTGSGYFWPVWPLLGWGLPLLTAKRGAALGSRRHGLAHLRPGSP